MEWNEQSVTFFIKHCSFGRAGGTGLAYRPSVVRLHSLKFLHKIRCTDEPETLSSQLLVNSSLRSRSTRQDADLALPRARTESGRRRLLFGIVQLYIQPPAAGNEEPIAGRLQALCLRVFTHLS